ncbi:MAG: GNAT family N-acetyltransferase [Pseudomonadota bacterium]
MPPPFAIQLAAPADLPRCQALRREVFVLGQGVPDELEIDGLDPACEHLLALDAAGRAIGTARLRSVGGGCLKAERVAVLPACRGRGLGRALMAALEDRARGRGLPRVVLNAQLSVLGFYEKLGYQAQGPVFHEAGIPHVRMERVL